MTTIFVQRDNTIVRTAVNEANALIHIVDPDPTDIETLTRDYGIDHDTIQDVLDVNERSRLEIEGDRTITILRVPVPAADEEVPFTTVPLGVFMLPGTTITLCRHDIPIVDILKATRRRAINLTDRSRLVPLILHGTSLRYLRFLKEINVQSERIESDLRHSVRNNELIGLLGLEKSLVHFMTSLRSNSVLFARLQRLAEILGLDDDELEEAYTEHRQAVETAEVHSNILSGMMDAFASVISNNLNIVMRRLTGISIVLMVPTLLASLYGMNVPLPFQHSVWALPLVVAVSLVLAIPAGFLLLGRKVP